MLDLTTMNSQLYEIRLLDGTELHIKRPNQAMVQYLVNIKELRDSDGDEMNVLKAFSSFFVRILNRNQEGKVYSDAQVAEDYDYQTMLYVINDYFEFWNKEVLDNVNFQADQLAVQTSRT